MGKVAGGLAILTGAVTVITARPRQRSEIE